MGDAFSDSDKMECCRFCNKRHRSDDTTYHSDCVKKLDQETTLIGKMKSAEFVAVNTFLEGTDDEKAILDRNQYLNFKEKIEKLYDRR